jgi:DNA-directed RNA polymerase subunit K/omega
MQHVVLIEKLTGVITNKYEAVRVIAKEARRINSLLIRGAQTEVEEKPTMMALKRVLDNKVKYDFTEGAKAKTLFEGDAE